MSATMNKLQLPLGVLYIEDNDDDALLYRRMLSREGFDVELARGLDEATQLLRNNRFDAVLLDLRLGESTGIETLRAVRKMTDLPVIVLSGTEDFHTVLDSIKAGARDYFVKDRTERYALKNAIQSSIEWWRMRGHFDGAP